ncbi:mucin-2-like isoform X3 [Branchiostoma lanceolatum]|uniref:mucin-2-like isoform X3 n=1 Tax=Branchiostoma lanceolatum TaxID=7740 RepID=UPI0034551A27
MDLPSGRTVLLWFLLVASAVSADAQNSATSISSCSTQTIGVQNKTIIPDDLMTASSQLNGSEAYRGRLNGDGAWQPSAQGTDQFLAVDLQYPHCIFGIQTQGQGEGYVESYRVIYQQDNTSSLILYSADGGSAKIFTGNSDNETIVQQNFTSCIYARYILINPQSFVGAPRLRIELLGCDELPTTTFPTTNPPDTTTSRATTPLDSTTPPVSTPLDTTASRVATPLDTTASPVSTPLDTTTTMTSTSESAVSFGLYQPFGVQDNTIIPDDLMTASSQLDGSEAYRGRLNGDGAWQPSAQGTDQFLAVDLLKNVYVVAIQTQGQGDGHVESYRVIYQRDNTTNLILYSEDGGSAKIFSGNSDNETIVQQNLTSYIYARYILINPQSFVGAPRLRMELLGVDDLPTTTFPATNPPGTTTTLATTPLIQTASTVSTPLDTTASPVSTPLDTTASPVSTPLDTTASPVSTPLDTTASPVSTPLDTTASHVSTLLDTTTTMTSTTESRVSFGLYQPFGVQDNTIIPDDLMTASSQLDGSEAYRGRLNGDGAWQPSAQGTDQFLAVDLLKNVYVVAIQTQGQGDGHVESYRVIYQRDNTTNLILYSEDGGSAKIFSGNSDNETIVQQNLTSYIYARYILINPQSFVGAPRLRMELLGVDDLPTTTFPATNPPGTITTLATTPLIQTASTVSTPLDTTASPVSTPLDTTASPVSTPLDTTASPVSTLLDTTTTMTSTTESRVSFGLYQPFGVQDNTIIPDDLMTASSQLDGSEAYRGRLNGDGAWQPSAQGTDQFLAVDLLKNVYVVAIQTQGQGDGHVESYRVIYQRDNTTNLILYSEDGGSAKIFSGNSDNETIVQQNLTSYIYARYILINPQSFVGAPRLRMELLGVDDLPTTTFAATNPPGITTTLATTPLIQTASTVSTPLDTTASPVSTPLDTTASPVSTPLDTTASPVSTPLDTTASPVSTPLDTTASHVSTLLDTTTTMTSTTESTVSFGLYQPFGVQDNTIIPDDLMTASSQLDGSEAYRGRLNGDGAWQPSAQGTDQFLAVDLLKNVYVVAIQTQGQGDGHVESYRVIYQRDNTTNLILYSEDGGSAKIFSGNSDNETIVQQNLTSYIYARYILINPQSFVGAPRLRIELLGVDDLPTTTFAATNPPGTTTTLATTPLIQTTSTVSTPFDTTTTTTMTSTSESTVSFGLYQPFGVQDNTIIPDDLMTASSQLDGSEAYRGRLNGDGAWQPSAQGTDQFLAVDLLKNVYVVAIQTQGQGDGHVESYRVIYQQDNTTNLILYSEDGGSAKIFSGNSDNETIVQQNLTSYIYARYILINPQSFVGAPRLRMELLGVDDLPTTTFAATNPPGTTTALATTPLIQTTSAATTPFDTASSTASNPFDTTISPASTPLDKTISAASTLLDTTISPASTPLDTTIFPASTPLDTTISPASTPLDTTISPASTPLDTTSSAASTPLDTTISPASTPLDTTISPASTPLDTTISPASTPLDTTISPASTPLDTTISPASTPLDTTSSPVTTPILTPSSPLVTIQITTSSDVTTPFVTTNQSIRSSTELPPTSSSFEATSGTTTEITTSDASTPEDRTEGPQTTFTFIVEESTPEDTTMEGSITTTTTAALSTELTSTTQSPSGPSVTSTIVGGFTVQTSMFPTDAEASTESQTQGQILASHSAISSTSTDATIDQSTSAPAVPTTMSTSSTAAPEVSTASTATPDVSTATPTVSTPAPTVSIATPTSTIVSTNVAATTQPAVTTQAVEFVTQSLGLSDANIITNEQITASSFTPGFEPFKGRLDSESAWQFNTSDPNPFLQVDLGKITTVTTIQTQGFTDGYVTSYTLSYQEVDIQTGRRRRQSVATFTDYMENGTVKVFEGNNDTSTVVAQPLAVPIVTQALRINPKNYSDTPQLRAGLIGLVPVTTAAPPTTTVGQTISTRGLEDWQLYAIVGGSSAGAVLLLMAIIGLTVARSRKTKKRNISAGAIPTESYKIPRARSSYTPRDETYSSVHYNDAYRSDDDGLPPHIDDTNIKPPMVGHNGDYASHAVMIDTRAPGGTKLQY